MSNNDVPEDLDNELDNLSTDLILVDPIQAIRI